MHKQGNYRPVLSSLFEPACHTRN